MAAVVLVVHPRRPNAAEYARKATAWLAERGQTVVMPEEDASALGMAELGVAPRRLAGLEVGDPELGDPDPGPDADADPDPDSRTARVDPTLVVALGGDGTVLRAVRLAADRGIPVLGVNLGHLGYLTQVEPEGLTAALARFLAGDYSIEDRMMLSVAIERRDRPGDTILALNDAVLEKRRPGNTVNLVASIGGRPWTTYVGDGLVVATPTGSTAYSFSARGPILSPTMKALVITPVCAHMAFDRSLVVGDGEAVRVEVGDDKPAALTVDGRERGLLRRGDAIVCAPAVHPARFVTLGDRDFYGVLKAKFGVADR